MAALKEDDRAALREALRRSRKGESFETALGITLRKRGLDYGEYIRLMSEVRELARKRKVTIVEAVKEMVRLEEK
jgi:hypothetical protein